MKTWPELGTSKPEIVRGSVDFPQPGRADEDYEFAIAESEINIGDNRNRHRNLV